MIDKINKFLFNTLPLIMERRCSPLIPYEQKKSDQNIENIFILPAESDTMCVYKKKKLELRM